MAPVAYASGQDLREVPFEGGAIGAIEQIFGAKQQVPARGQSDQEAENFTSSVDPSGLQTPTPTVDRPPAPARQNIYWLGFCATEVCRGSQPLHGSPLKTWGSAGHRAGWEERPPKPDRVAFFPGRLRAMAGTVPASPTLRPRRILRASRQRRPRRG